MQTFEIVFLLLLLFFAAAYIIYCVLSTRQRYKRCESNLKSYYQKQGGKEDELFEIALEKYKTLFLSSYAFSRIHYGLIILSVITLLLSFTSVILVSRFDIVWSMVSASGSLLDLIIDPNRKSTKCSSEWKRIEEMILCGHLTPDGLTNIELKLNDSLD